VEQRVLHALQTQLLSPEAMDIYVTAYHRRSAERRADATGREAKLLSRLGEIGRRAARLVDAIEEGIAGPDTKERLQALDAERQAINASLRAIEQPADTIALHPHAGAQYAREVADLQARLAEASQSKAPAEQKLVASIRSLVERIIVRPSADYAGAPYDLEVVGRLDDLIRPKVYGSGGSWGRD
jgi:site-specific DNA recombinase